MPLCPISKTIRFDDDCRERRRANIAFHGKFYPECASCGVVLPPKKARRGVIGMVGEVGSKKRRGGVAERSKAAVLKTVDPKGPGVQIPPPPPVENESARAAICQNCHGAKAITGRLCYTCYRASKPYPKNSPEQIAALDAVRKRREAGEIKKGWQKGKKRGGRKPGSTRLGEKRRGWPKGKKRKVAL